MAKLSSGAPSTPTTTLAEPHWERMSSVRVHNNALVQMRVREFERRFEIFKAAYERVIAEAHGGVVREKLAALRAVLQANKAERRRLHDEKRAAQLAANAANAAGAVKAPAAVAAADAPSATATPPTADVARATRPSKPSRTPLIDSRLDEIDRLLAQYRRDIDRLRGKVPEEMAGELRTLRGEIDAEIDAEVDELRATMVAQSGGGEKEIFELVEVSEVNGSPEELRAAEEADKARVDAEYKRDLEAQSAAAAKLADLDVQQVVQNLLQYGADEFEKPLDAQVQQTLDEVHDSVNERLDGTLGALEDDVDEDGDFIEADEADDGVASTDAVAQRSDFEADDDAVDGDETGDGTTTTRLFTAFDQLVAEQTKSKLERGLPVTEADEELMNEVMAENAAVERLLGEQPFAPFYYVDNDDETAHNVTTQRTATGNERDAMLLEGLSRFGLAPVPASFGVTRPRAALSFFVRRFPSEHTRAINEFEMQDAKFRERRVSVVVNLAEFALPPLVEARLIALVGVRYCADSHSIKMSADSQPNVSQNRQLLVDTLRALLNDAFCADSNYVAPLDNADSPSARGAAHEHRFLAMLDSMGADVNGAAFGFLSFLF